MNEDIKVAAIAQKSDAADQGLLGIIGAIMLGTLLLFSAQLPRHAPRHGVSLPLSHA